MAEIPTIKYKNNNEWIDILHPVSSFYFSSNEISPFELFGGTWTQITNAAIRGNNNDRIGYTGSDTNTLTESNMPKHRHYEYAMPNTNGGYAKNGWNVAAKDSWGGFLYNQQMQRGYTEYTGGALLSMCSNVPSIVIFGIELRKYYLFGGDIDAIPTL